MAKDDYRVDCIFQAGELDKSGYSFLDNDLKVFEVVKHNVPYSEFKKWRESPECLKRRQELEAIGRKRFGEDYWMKYQVCCFCCLAEKDEDKKNV